MNVTAYWYFKEGRLSEHVIPPEDPDETPYAILTLKDVGKGITTGNVTLYIKNKPVGEENFTSVIYNSRTHFRSAVVSHIKKILAEQRQITEWAYTRKSKKTTKPKRKTKVKK